MHLTKLASLHRLDDDTSLLVNALSGAVDLVDNDLRAKLLEIGAGKRPSLQQDHYEPLVARGYLFGSEEEERASLGDLYQAYQRVARARPLQLVVFPTYACNLACTYCFEDARARARPEVMTGRQVTDLFAAIGKLLAMQPGRTGQLVLFGGEPLLPRTEAVVADLLDEAERAELPLHVVTNGTHLERFAPLLGRHREAVRGVQITLDGPQPVHDARRKWANGRGSFAEVVRGVEVCFEAGLPVRLRVNLDAENIGCLEDVAELLEQRGWLGHEGFRCQLAPVTDHLGTKLDPATIGEDKLVEPVVDLWRRRPELREALRFHLFRVLHHLVSALEPGAQSRSLPRFHYCEVDRGEVLAFGPDGLIYVCPESAGVTRYAVGVYSPRYQLWPRRLERWQRRNVLTLPECQECTIATFCGGGCAYAALRQSGSSGHGACGDAPRVVAAYIAVLRERFLRGDSTLAA